MRGRTFLAASAAIPALRGQIETPDNTQALLVVQDRRILHEWYAPGRTASSPHYMASATKALVGGTSLLLATADGRLRANEPASKYIPSWRDDPQKSKITIRHLATHTSGLEDSSVPGIAHPNEPGWKGRFWKREPDPFTIAINEAPLLFAPGQGYEYSNPGMAALAYAVTASLKGAPQPTIESLLRERVMEPLGIVRNEWTIGYGRAYKVDGLELYANWGGANFSPRATARVAEWMMNGGEFGGRQLVPRSAVNQALKYAGMRLPDRRKDPFVPASGLCWYTNFDGVWPTVPRDAFAAAGAGLQVVLIVPSLHLIVVRNGGELPQRRPSEGYWTRAYQQIFEPVMKELGFPGKPAEPAYPKSTVIRGVSFAPASTVIRKAVECDNWPLTWADDDHLYTSYGDGMGFEPHVPTKLGMGFARIEGSPVNFRGVNIRSATGERLGDGPRSAKGSGMLMVDQVLYMWVRNVGNAQLLKSADHGQTWEWGFKFEHGFGSPAFLNFGKNYAGARDEYVYTYSQSGPSAYETDDDILLARAPKSRIFERNAWQFFTHVDSDGKPHWTPEIAASRRVLHFPNHCQRVDALYHPQTKRQLLLIAYGHNGGWGLFDAPEPWGPWSVAFHTEYWGLGETHGYRLPSKWISKDGRTLAMVFSGLIYDGISYDAFCVRNMTLDFK